MLIVENKLDARSRKIDIKRKQINTDILLTIAM